MRVRAPTMWAALHVFHLPCEVANAAPSRAIVRLRLASLSIETILAAQALGLGRQG